MNFFFAFGVFFLIGSTLVSSTQNAEQYQLPSMLAPSKLFDAQEIAMMAKSAGGPHHHNLGRNYANVQCQPRYINQCQMAFSESLNSHFNIFRNVKQLADIFRQQYNQSLESGLLRLCEYRANFYNCLRELYEPCTDPFQIFLSQQPISMGNAFYLSYVYKSLAFDCLGGNVQLTTNYETLLDVWKNDDSIAANQACDSTFRNLNRTTLEEFCSDSQIYLECSANVYLNTTNPSKELAWWRCEHTRVGFQVDGFCPNLDCNSVLLTKANNGTATVSTNISASFVSGSLDEKWQRQFIGGGAFVSDARINLYKKLG